MTDSRYGTLRVSKIRECFNALRDCVRRWDFEGAESALDRYEQWADYLLDERHRDVKVPESWLDLSIIPDGWFLERLTHSHTPIKFAHNVHQPSGPIVDGKKPWLVELQHVKGGRLTKGAGDSPSGALARAVYEVEMRWMEKSE